jgi:Ca2+/Na+ antiporter
MMLLHTAVWISISFLRGSLPPLTMCILIALSVFCCGYLFWISTAPEQKDKAFDFEVEEAVEIVETVQEVILNKEGQVSPYEWQKMNEFIKKHKK